VPINVLYIDDDAGLGRLVSRTLARHDCVVTHVPSGDEGLAQLRAHRFDIVGLDHFMPGRDGLDILEEIQRTMPDAPPVIYVTGTDEGRVAIAALKAGAADYVIKDVGNAFIDLFRQAIDQALVQVALRRAKEAAETEMREARERAEILLREVNHRVANSLQLVASLVTMQQKTAPEGPAREALAEAHGRIHAIAQVHRRLYTSNDVRFVDMSGYLEGLSEELSAAMQMAAREHTLTLEAAPLRIATDKAVAVGVIVSELVTNAFKYAYPAGASGEIRIRLWDGDNTVSLAVEDDGAGWTGSGPIQGSGLGMRIIKAMAASLQAQLVYEERPAGTRAVLSFEM
jgi:two-component sensor histidine kinase